MKKTVSILLVITLVMSVFGMCALTVSADNDAETLKANHIDSDFLTTHGRTYYKDNNLYFNWGYSGFSVKINGTALSGRIYSKRQPNYGEDRAAYINVYLNSDTEAYRTICLKEGWRDYTLVDGLPEGEYTVTVRKRTEVEAGGSAALSSLSVDGSFLPPPSRPTRKIEFIGDSILAGCCNAEITQLGGFDTRTEDSTLVYGSLAAEILGAEGTVLAKSGICATAGPAGDEYWNSMRETYLYTDYWNNNSLFYDYSMQSDVVVIGLGDNDWALSLSREAYISQFTTFLNQVRLKNPNSEIIWTYGVRLQTNADIIEETINNARNAGDTKVHFYRMREIEENEGVATGYHPTILTNRIRAVELADEISRITGWDKQDGSIKYEAENAAVTGEARVCGSGNASGNKKVGYINNSSSVVTFNVKTEVRGPHLVTVRAAGSTQGGVIPSNVYWTNSNTSDKKQVEYTKATDWDSWNDYQIYLNLEQGENTISFSNDTNRPNSFAEIDYITVCPVPEKIKYEAEDALLTGETEKYMGRTNSAGYKVGGFNNTESGATFSLTAPVSGEYRIQVNAESDAAKVTAPSHDYYVNGNKADKKNIRYSDSSEWGVWSKYYITVYLNSGINTLTFTYAGGSSHSNLDYIVFYPSEGLEKRSLSRRYEAENGMRTGTASTMNFCRDDSSNNACVGNLNGPAAAVTFTVTMPAAGEYPVYLCGSTAFDNGAHKIYANGDSANSKIIMYENNNWGNWGLYGTVLPLKAGTNTITVTHSGLQDSFAELDYIDVFSTPFDFTVKLGGSVIAGFTPTTHEYTYSIQDPANIPSISCVYNNSLWRCSIDQPDRNTGFGTASFTSRTDSSLTLSYKINLNDPYSFKSRVISYGADPWVTFENGVYYYMNTDGGSFYISSSPDISRINSNPVLVYTPSGNEPDTAIWAPELHLIDGKWYIYYTAAINSTSSMHHMYCLRSKTDDPLGEYEFCGELSPATSAWSIDMTVLELDNSLYAVYSSIYDGQQRLYIARMSDPCTIVGDRVLLSEAEYEFECYDSLNEAPQILKSPDGTVRVIYSANGYQNYRYCFGMLTLNNGADPMLKSNWVKFPQSVFEYSTQNSTYGVGHGSFVTSPDSSEFYMVYHARNSLDGSAMREVRVQRFFFNEDGTPDFGVPLNENDNVFLPLGTQRIDYTRYEAENAVLSGAGAYDVYWASNGKRVGNLDTGTVTFNVNVNTSGTYKLSLKAAYHDLYRSQVGLSATVNSTVYNKATPGRGWDNFYYYDLNVPLNAGSNTITVGKSSIYAYTPDLDCIELSSISGNEKPAAPDAPIISGVFADSVVLASSGAGTEYRVNGGQWQSSTVFTGLNQGETYSFTARYAASGNTPAGDESTAATAETRYFGDADLSRSVTSSDALIVLNSSIGNVTLDSDIKVICDVNNDNSVNSVDALYILKYSVRLISSFPAQNP